MSKSNPKPTDAEDGPDEAAGAKRAPAEGGKRKLVITAALILVLGGLGGAYFFGLLGGLLGKSGGAAPHASAQTPPGFVDVAEIVANLNAGPRRTSFVRLKARLELADKADEAAVQAAQPRIRDLFQTYLRDMRPEELRGSAGTYRLREELTARANVALAPARVTEILFVELLIQ